MHSPYINVLFLDITAIAMERYNGRKSVQLENVLYPHTAYEFRVSAFNEFGYGLPSSPSRRHVTQPDIPYKAPSNIRGGGGKIGDLTVTWDPLKPSEQNGEQIYYDVFYRRKGSQTEFVVKSLQHYGNIGSAVVAQGTPYYTEYEVRVQAINQIGKGPISEIYTVYSAEDMPQVAPQLVVALSYNSTSLNVSWSPIEQVRELIRGKLIGHRIKYWKKNQPEEGAVYYLSRTTRPWSLVVGLQPDTYYYVKVQQSNYTNLVCLGSAVFDVDKI